MCRDASSRTHEGRAYLLWPVLKPRAGQGWREAQKGGFFPRGSRPGPTACPWKHRKARQHHTGAPGPSALAGAGLEVRPAPPHRGRFLCLGRSAFNSPCWSQPELFISQAGVWQVESVVKVDPTSSACLLAAAPSSSGSQTTRLSTPLAITDLPLALALSSSKTCNTKQTWQLLLICLQKS